jgi:predicted DCC family thiol-disulfide oxidoreductase YuxK
MASEPENTGITIVYDGECPFCSRYVAMARLRELSGSVDLINARESNHPVVSDVKKRGYDLDDGMVAIYRGQYFHGADCVHLVAGLTSDSGLFNRVNSLVFRSKSVSRFLYPFMRAGRNFTLTLLGREKLSETDHES